MKPGIFARKAQTGFVLLALGTALGLPGAFSQPAQAAPVKNGKINEIKLSYDVHGAGFKLMTIDFDIIKKLLEETEKSENTIC